MNLTKLTLKRSRIAITIFMMIVVAGMLQFNKMSRDSMPGFTVRVASIVSAFPGASPERVEMLVSKPIEEKVQEIASLKTVTSNSRSGLSIVVVELKDEVSSENLQENWDKLRRKLQTITTLPQGVQPQLKDDIIGEVFGLSLGLSSDGLTPKQLEVIAKDMRDEIIAMPETAKVILQGVQKERVYVDYDNATIARYGLTPSKLQGLIASTNILYSGGFINLGSERIVLEPTGNFNSIEQLKKLIIPLPNNEIVYLGDIAKVHEGYIKPAQTLVRADGESAISLAISTKKGQNIVELGTKIDAYVAKYQKKLPAGTYIKRITSLDSYVDERVSEFNENLVQSIVIVLAVMLLFLGLRTGFIIASLVPTVILGTLMFMGWLQVGLNQVTLAALIMSMGMMVDNAVVVAELIMVKLEEGKSRFIAATEACSELTVPLLSSTLTTSFAFLAFYLAESAMGDIMGPLFVVITIALFVSWFLSLTLIALLSFLYLKVEKDTKPRLFDKFINALKNRYTKFIDAALKAKYTFLALIMVVFVGSLMLFKFVPFNFFPESDRNLVTVDITLSPDSRFEETTRVVHSVEKFIQDTLAVQSTTDTSKKLVSNFASYIGEGPESYDLGYMKDEAKPNYAHMLLTTVDDEFNGDVIQALDAYTLANLPTADIKVKRLSGAAPVAPVEIFVYGDNHTTLEEIGYKIKEKLKHTNGTKNVADNWGMRIKKLSVQINQERAQKLGINNQQIAQTLESNLNGVQTGVYRGGDTSIPIVMRNNNENEITLENLQSLTIISAYGQKIPLLEVATLQPEWQYSSRRRKDLSSVIMISSELLEGETAATVTARFDDWLQEYSQSWPDGYSFVYGGQDKVSEENFVAVLNYLPLCGFMILMLLIAQFNSFRKMSIILMTIPLGVIGVAWGLLVLRSYFGFMAFLGMISLAGIVINNAIVLIDRIDLELERGLEPVEAVKEACLQRFRPILLTSFTTILGLIPLYVSGGLIWQPMAAVLMMGLLVGTLISLVFVPVMYTVLYKLEG